MVNSLQVKFDKNLTWRNSRHCKYMMSRCKGIHKLIVYRNLFEQCYVRVGILRGDIGELEERPILPPNLPKSVLSFLLQNGWANERVRSGPELFKLYEKLYHKSERAFWREMKKTRYYGTFGKTTPTAPLKKKLKRAFRLYNRVKRARRLVPAKTVWQASDFPQVITFKDYQKNLDGTHRRMVMHSLGFKTIPSWRVRVEDITRDGLKGNHPFLVKHFDLFRKAMERCTSG